MVAASHPPTVEASLGCIGPQGIGDAADCGIARVPEIPIVFLTFLVYFHGERFGGEMRIPQIF
jgi:hypothetical protein